MQSELNILSREIERERKLLRHDVLHGLAQSARVSRANILTAIVRYCRLADAGRKLTGLAGIPLRPEFKRPAPIDVDPMRQSKLFAGLDCLPGQQDLFETDGRG